MRTPTTAEGLRRYDELSPAEAALASWRCPGARPDWHRRAQQVVRQAAPLLAAALDCGDEHWVATALRPVVPVAVREAMPLLARAADRS